MAYDAHGMTIAGTPVSTAILGCWSFSGDATWGPQDDAESIQTIHAALDAGITTFDTAPAYGNGRSEEVLGRALADRRSKALILDKVGGSDAAPEPLRASCESSLRRLRTDVIDLLQVHWANHDVPMEATFGELTRLLEEGKIRAIGVCNFGPVDLRYVYDLAEIASNQIAYSALARGAEAEVLPLCSKLQIPVLPYSPLQQGLLTGKFRSADEVPEGRARTRHFSTMRASVRHGENGHEDETFRAIATLRDVAVELGIGMVELALGWLRTRPMVAGIIAGARTPEQAIANARATATSLPAEAIAKVDAATERLRIAMGPDIDLWMTATNSRVW